MLILNHKKLIGWQKSIELLPMIYSICLKLPDNEKFNLVSQIKRAGLSVSNNLAEGSARNSSADRKNFYRIARSSLVEVDNCLEAALALKMLTKPELDIIENHLEQLFRIITALINSTSK